MGTSSGRAALPKRPGGRVEPSFCRDGLLPGELGPTHGHGDPGDELLEQARGQEHLVACFDAAHEHVYGFPSPELRGPKLWKCAVSAATRTLNDYFAGDVEEAARYVQWAWAREARAWESGKRRERPIGWRLVFGVMVGDYLKARRDRERRAA